MAIKYKVTYHYDVWGNEDDGWQVNDSSRQGSIEVKANCTDAEVWAACEVFRVLPKRHHHREPLMTRIIRKL